MNEKRIDVLGVGFDNFTMEEAVDEGVRLMNEPERTMWSRRIRRL